MMNPAPQTPHFVSPENRYCGRFATPIAAPADLGAPSANRLTGDGGWGYQGEERAQDGRSVGELWVVAGSASGIQVSVTGVMRCEPGDQNIRAGQSRAM
jgi:hypothetical protein